MRKTKKEREKEGERRDKKRQEETNAALQQPRKNRRSRFSIIVEKAVEAFEPRGWLQNDGLERLRVLEFRVLLSLARESEKNRGKIYPCDNVARTIPDGSIDASSLREMKSRIVAWRNVVRSTRSLFPDVVFRTRRTSFLFGKKRKRKREKKEKINLNLEVLNYADKA